jgi:hypothetical protein
MRLVFWRLWEIMELTGICLRYILLHSQEYVEPPTQQFREWIWKVFGTIPDYSLTDTIPPTNMSP